MSYAITIRRDESPISYDEWLEVARADPDLRSDGFSRWKSPAGELEHQVFSWRPPEADESEGAAAFVYYDGRITVDHADEAWMAKVAAVAATLNARAVGDDGETYDLTGKAHPPPRPAGVPLWRRLFRAK